MAYVLNKEDYDNCVSYDTEPYEGPLAVQVPSEEGITYVVCGVGVHCTQGSQKPSQLLLDYDNEYFFFVKF